MAAPLGEALPLSAAPQAVRPERRSADIFGPRHLKAVPPLVRRRPGRSWDPWPDRAVNRGGTEPANDAVYYAQVGAVDQLDHEQLVELMQTIEVGVLAAERLAAGEADDATARDLARLAVDGEQAKLRVITANLRLVVAVARQHRWRGVDLADLVQEGNLGLMRAVEKFDHTMGWTFATYATWWIRQAIGRAVADQARVLRLPAHVIDKLGKLERAHRALGDRAGRAPTVPELAEAVELAADRVRDLMLVRRRTLSLDRYLDAVATIDADAADLLDPSVEPPADQVAGRQLGAQVHALLATLPEREADVLRLRYGFGAQPPRTLDEIGRHYALTRERIRQIENRALKRLRDSGRMDELRDYLR